MRIFSTLLAVLLLASCQQNPEHLAQGEDDPAYRHGQNRNPYAADAKLAGMMASGKMERTADIRDQNILVEVRWVQADDEFFQKMSFGVRYKTKREGEREFVVGQDDLFEANGLAVTVLSVDQRKQFLFHTREENNRETRVRANMLSVLNRGRGAIEMLKDQPSGAVVLRTPSGNVVADERALTGARLVVQPEIIDAEKELIRVKVWPELAGMRPDGSVNTQKIQSDVVINNGGILLIGGNTEVNDSLGTELFSKNIANVRKNLLVLLTVRY